MSGGLQVAEITSTIFKTIPSNLVNQSLSNQDYAGSYLYFYLMTAGQILLIVISGLGVLHGMFLALFLLTNTKGNLLANRLLSILLIILSFRVGKSVFLEFLDKLDAKFIFIGLGTMMIIGPIFHFYTKAIADKSFRWSNKLLIHFIPALLAILFGFWIEERHLETLPRILFAFLFLKKKRRCLETCSSFLSLCPRCRYQGASTSLS